MLRMALACLLLAAYAPAAPVPKPNSESEWGRPVNPGKKSKFTFAKGAVTIELPGCKQEYHWLRPGWPEKGSAPGLVRTVKGDFRAQVRARGEFRPVPPGEERSGGVSVSMVIYGDGEGKFAKGLVARLGAHAARDKDTNGERRIRTAVVAFSDMKGRVNGGRKIMALQRHKGGEKLPGRKGDAVPAADVDWDGVWEVHFRVERKGGEVAGFISLDGKKWHGMERPPAKRPDGTTGMKISGDVKVGVAAESSSGGKFKVTFDNFTLTPLKAEKKAKKD